MRNETMKKEMAVEGSTYRAHCKEVLGVTPRDRSLVFTCECVCVLRPDPLLLQAIAPRTEASHPVITSDMSHKETHILRRPSVPLRRRPP